MTSCQSASLRIKTEFDRTVQLIRSQYRARIDQLSSALASLQQKNQSLLTQLHRKDEELLSSGRENKKLKGQTERYESLVLTLQRANERVIEESGEKLKMKEQQINQLNAQIKELNQEIRQLKTVDTLSMDQSTISLQQQSRQNFSFEISQLFKNFPTEINNFLDSIEGEYISEPKEIGDMVVMFVSKDNISLQKYLNVNRSFLKKKIKQHIKRFRYVLIYKPDK